MKGHLCLSKISVKISGDGGGGGGVSFPPVQTLTVCPLLFVVAPMALGDHKGSPPTSPALGQQCVPTGAACVASSAQPLLPACQLLKGTSSAP